MQTQEKVTELNTCPFCGGEAQFDNFTTNYGNVYTVCCKRCHAMSRQSFREETAINAWNRRYEPPNPPLTLDELGKMDGEPVWIESPDMPNRHGWAINYGLDPDVMHIQYAEIALDMYGKTWIAYRRRPEEA